MSLFPLTIVTPDGEFFKGEAERVVARSIDGDVCILGHHTNYITAISTGEVRVTVDEKVRRAACSGGMLSVLDNKINLVATTFEWEEDIDASRAENAKERAEQLLKNTKDDAELKLAKAKLDRALIRIKVAK